MREAKVRLLRVLFIILSGVAALLIFFGLPLFAGEMAVDFPEIAGWRWPLTIYLWGTSIPFYWAIWEALRITGSVLRRDPFRLDNVRSLRRIGKCALSEGILYLLGYIVVSLYISRHPSFLLGLILILLVSGVIFLLCEILAGLFSQAIQMKNENELTI